MIFANDDSCVNRLALPLCSANVELNSAGETTVSLGESVRDDDVYIINTGCGNVNQHLMETMIMVSNNPVLNRTLSINYITIDSCMQSM